MYECWAPATSQGERHAPSLQVSPLLVSHSFTIAPTVPSALHCSTTSLWASQKVLPAEQSMHPLVWSHFLQFDEQIGFMVSRPPVPHESDMNAKAQAEMIRIAVIRAVYHRMTRGEIPTLTLPSPAGGRGRRWRASRASISRSGRRGDSGSACRGRGAPPGRGR